MRKAFVYGFVNRPGDKRHNSEPPSAFDDMVDDKLLAPILASHNYSVTKEPDCSLLG